MGERSKVSAAVHAMPFGSLVCPHTGNVLARCDTMSQGPLPLLITEKQKRQRRCYFNISIRKRLPEEPSMRRQLQVQLAS